MGATGPNPVKRSATLAAVSILALGGTSILIGCLALVDSQSALNASLRGVAVWWEVLFPALFPFFVLSELLLGFGIVHFAGTLLDPFMRPLFRLPGVGGFIVAMGFVSGYPIGARLTSRLMEQNLVSRDEGERLVAMTTTSDPIFLIGAVCIGFFGSLQAAPVLAAAHYSGALLIGAASRFGKSAAQATEHPATSASAPGVNRFRAAIVAMHRARLADGRPLGILLQQALQSSLALMVIVGGLVVFFSATLELLVKSGILSLFKDTVAQLLDLARLSPNLSSAFVDGTFEVTLGAKAAAADTGIPLTDRVAAAAFVLSWAGLSVHAQVAGLMSGTTWRYGLFARARLIHGFLAMLLVYLLWPIFYPKAGSDPSAAFLPEWAAAKPAWASAFAEGAGLHSVWTVAAYLPLLFAAVLSSIVALGALAIGVRRFLRGSGKTRA
nr:nucleoside recognition domain-containing protein [Cohnella terricola]